ncbi:uncharacterized protein [Lolium perenne]|uniref:uncharacterized protein n=1 Tax=Lolium perenne TaxID=4522 RepID=UPI0021E9FC1B|nr:protein E6-like [Lolium perenne]
MASSPSHLFILLAMAVLLAAAAPSVDAWGGRLFFSKMTRPETVDRAADATTTAGTTEALDANSAPAAFSSRPSSGGSNRGYGLYGRPEENERYPPAYFRRGVHHDAEKRTTTNTNVVPEAAAAVPAGEQQEETESAGEKVEPAFPENGSGRGRPLSDMRHGGKGKRGDYGMSDTRLYQNGRYYYDVEADRYGYGRESNPVRTRPEPEDNGSGYGRPGGERRSGRYGGNNEQNDDGFEEDQNEQYNP